MLLTEIYQPKSRKPVAFCYGRVNPPTIGHARLFNTTARASKGGDYYIFLSHTQDSKKNPLDYNTKVDKEKIKEELADVFAYAFLLAEKQGLDVKQIVLDKIKRNGEKYPVDKSKGSAKKYNEL